MEEEKKHKLYVSEGCVCFCYDIDGKDFYDYTKEEVLPIINELVKRETKQEVLNGIWEYETEEELEEKNITKVELLEHLPQLTMDELFEYFRELVTSQGDTERDEEPCPQCGDYVQRWWLVI